MNIRYKRKANESYMVIQDKGISLENYKIKMICKNHIKGLLETYAGTFNDTVELTYKVSSKQSLSDFFMRGKLGYEEIRNIIKSMIHLDYQVNRYFLNMDEILLQPEYIYLSKENKELEFCYCTKQNHTFRENFKEFIQQLIQVTNHSDTKAIQLIYQVFELSNQEEFLISDLEQCKLEEIQQEPKENVTEYEGSHQIVKKEIGKSQEWEDFELQKVTEMSERKEFKKQNFLRKEPSGKALVNKESVNKISSNKKMTNKEVINKEKRYHIAEKIRQIFWKLEKVKEPWEEDDEEEEYYNGVSEEAYRYPTVQEMQSTPVCMEESETMYVKDIIKQKDRQLFSMSELDDIEILTFPCVIGKSSGKVDKIIRESEVSRIHVKLDYDKDRDVYTIEDLNSKNGTFLNDEILNPYEIVDIEIGDKIRIASFDFIFR